MPHCVIEYAKAVESQVDIQNLCTVLHEAIIKTDLFTPSAVKTRSVAYEHYVVGEDGNREQPFIHVTLSILEGRSLKARTALSDRLFALLKEYASGIKQRSVNLHEMDKQTYRK